MCTTRPHTCPSGYRIYRRSLYFIFAAPSRFGIGCSVFSGCVSFAGRNKAGSLNQLRRPTRAYNFPCSGDKTHLSHRCTTFYCAKLTCRMEQRRLVQRIGTFK
jgi:hypothetical protein